MRRSPFHSGQAPLKKLVRRQKNWREELVIKRLFIWRVGWGIAAICLLFPSTTFAQEISPTPADAAEVERVIVALGKKF
jgi:hypothetical protein